jgi:hypothetical protein
VEYSAFSGTDVNMRKGIFPFQKKAPFTPGYISSLKVVDPSGVEPETC